ncbi:MAG: hypothetical protein WC795_02945 [Candidatus Paceibacterota bacterium]|jgi:hypothetical protein
METSAKKHSSIFLSIYILVSGLLWIAYFILTFSTPLTEASNKFNLTLFSRTLLQISIILPIFIAWFASFYATIGLKKYTDLIIVSEDGKAVRLIGVGISVLIFGLVLSLVAGSLRGYILAYYTEYLKLFVIINNYITVAVPLVSYWLIFKGSYKLALTVTDKKFIKSNRFFPICITLVLSAVYIVSLFLNPIRQSSPYPGTPATYYLSDLWILLTICIPYIIGWFLGVFSICNLKIFTKKTTGFIYKKSFKRFNLGITIIVGFSIMMQILSSFSVSFRNISFDWILVIVYIIIAILVAGYLILASGVNKLKDIEIV